MIISNDLEQPDILIIEDDEISLYIISSFLKKSGYTIRAIQNPESGVQSAFSSPPSLILLDISTSKSDGFGICKILKEDTRTQKIPIIFLTDQSDKTEIERGFELGGVDFISKPFYREEILTRVRANLSISQTQSELEKRVRERTRELELNLRHLGEVEEAMDRAGIGIYRIAIETGKILYFNETFLRMHGFTPEDLPPANVQELISGLTGFYEYEANPDHIDAGRKKFETTHRHKNGNVFPVEVTLNYHEETSDFPPHFIAFITDISLRKSFEEEIRLHSEQQGILRNLIEHTLSTEPIDVTLEHCLKKIQETSWLGEKLSCAIFVTEKESNRLRLRANRNYPAANFPAGNVYYDQCDLTGYYCAPLFTNMQIKGSLLLDIHPGYMASDEKIQYLGAISNILSDYLSRKEHEHLLIEQRNEMEESIRSRTAALKISEARTRAIVTTMLDSVININSNGVILSVNLAVQGMFGYSEIEMVGNNVSMLMPEPDSSSHNSYLSRYMLTQKANFIGSRREVYARHKNGNIFPVELAVNAIQDDFGTTFIGVLRDLTLQKESEKLMQQALANAKAAAVAKSNFLANMSHEIRTPLNAVLGMAQIGVRDSSEARLTDTFRRILDSGNHLLQVVNDILDFSKIEAGKFSVENRPFALLQVIENVKTFVSVKAGEKNLDLTITMAPDLSEWVEGDSLRLIQILTNLLSNAVKFTENGEVMLRIARDEYDVFFMISDTGIGMSEAQLARIFMPFEQADNSTTRNFGGTGLGLVISKELANLMGGDIDVDSNPGIGSSFYLRLPLPPVSAPSNHALGASEILTGKLNLKGIRVLAADDVQINRVILEDMLINEGAQVEFAYNGKEAITKLNEIGSANIDIILMDVQMPIMDGLEATRLIKKIAPRLPVIGLTAHAMTEERNKCFSAGMDEHIAKPVDAHTLIKTILSHVNTARKTDPEANAPMEETSRNLETGKKENHVFTIDFDPGIIDLNILAARADNDPKRIEKYARMYVDTIQEALTEMKQAISNNDISNLTLIAHRLKPTSIAVGAIRLGEICKDLEALKDSKDLNQAAYLVNQVQELSTRINQSIDSALKQPTKSAENFEQS